MKKSIPNEANTVEADIEEDQSAEVSMGRTEKYYAEKLTTSLNEPDLPDTEVRLIDYGAQMEDWMNTELQENDFVIGDWGIRIPRTFWHCFSDHLSLIKKENYRLKEVCRLPWQIHVEGHQLQHEATHFLFCVCLKTMGKVPYPRQINRFEKRGYLARADRNFED